MVEGAQQLDIVVTFDPAAHSRSSLLRVAYALAERIVLDLREIDGSLAMVGTARGAENCDEIRDAIRIAAVDFALREEIEAKTFGLRDVIWRTAFAESTGPGR